MLKNIFCNRLKSKPILFVIPYIEYWIANRKIVSRIDRIDNEVPAETDWQYVVSPDHYELDLIQKYYNKTLSIKESLEEKIRAILVSITLAATLVIGLLTLIYNQSFSSFDSYVKVGIVILGSLSMFYTVMGAIFALRMLGNRIKVYQLFPNDERNIKNEEKSECLAILTEQNANMNIIRQNTVYICYTSTIYALIMLSILFVTMAFFSIKKRDVSIMGSNKYVAIMAQIKNNQISLESVGRDLGSLKREKENEELQILSVISNSNTKINAINHELEDLRRKNIEYKSLIDNRKKNP